MAEKNVTPCDKPTHRLFKDREGYKVGMLTVNSLAGYILTKQHSKRYYWNCLCECGGSNVVAATHLSNGRISNCGCIRRKHGDIDSTEYKSWCSMKTRCSATIGKSPYKELGICKAWDTSYSQFLKDMGRKPTTAHTIDRKDGTKGYSPDNCKWSTRKEQANNRRNNIRITLNGVTLNIMQWTKKMGFNAGLIYDRINYGWTPEKAIMTPVRKKCR